MYTYAEVKSKAIICNMDSLDDDLTISLLKSKNKPKESSEKNEWEAERNIFELQLTQLQEQLVASMVHNQNLEEEIKKLKSTSGFERLTNDLEEETSRRKKAEEKVQRLVALNRSKSENYQNEVEDSEVRTDKMETSEKISRRQKFKHNMLEYKILLWNFLHERVSDFVNEDDFVTEEEEEEQLSVKRLKENLSRFSDAIQPLKKWHSFINDLFLWKNPWLTIVVFIVFMYSLWIEVAIPCLLMLILLQLSINYLHVRGIAQKFTITKHSIKEESKEDTTSSSSLSERYQLVLQIARTVQNTLGGLADAFEKLQNLFMWQHEEATKKLSQYLFLLFVVSIILPVNFFFWLLGVAVGIKCFLITPIYTSYPKVQRRYDDFQRLWTELPTHVENVQRKLEEFERNEELKKDAAEDSPTSSRLSPSKGDKQSEKQNEEDSLESIVFGDRFQLPSNEAPLPDWQEGRRCTLMDKESPLSSMKHGRLYLTANYICFERSQLHSKKNFTIKLADIVNIKKAKPISFMPGPGMAIEIEVKGTSKPYMFAAIIGRDEAFDNIIRAGKILNLPWSKT